MGSTIRRTAAAVVASAALLCGTAQLTAQQTPTLGQLALKEQERRKALKASGKVLADLPKVPATPASQAAPATPKDPAAEEKSADKKEEPKDEAWWRQRMSQAREELRRSEMFAEALQTRINSLSNDFSARDDPYQRARVAEDRQKALAEMDRVRTDVEAQKKKIADIEEEARQAGVPPGWVR
ncbi:hypothetical protein BH18ACI5_BH18ACI5_23900 [soil metagenome]